MYLSALPELVPKKKLHLQQYVAASIFLLHRPLLGIRIGPSTLPSIPGDNGGRQRSRAVFLWPDWQCKKKLNHEYLPLSKLLACVASVFPCSLGCFRTIVSFETWVILRWLNPEILGVQ